MSVHDSSIALSAPPELAERFTAPVSPVAPRDISARDRVGLNLFFALAERLPWLLRLIRPAAIRVALRFAPSTREAIEANAARLFDSPLSSAKRRAFSRAVLRSFYDFVTDLGRHRGRSMSDLLSQIGNVSGEDRYRAIRAQRRGAVLVTAHMGAFEVGLAALRQYESNVHVVFKRDGFGAFERIRAASRATLGVHEAPIDDGLPSLLKLRDALRADGVVVMQADRAEVGQKSQVVKIRRGHLRLPIGPVKLARLTGSPIVPVFVVRNASGTFDVQLAEPVEPAELTPRDEGALDPALAAIGAAIDSILSRYPEQWLVLHRAFVEDDDCVA